MGLYISILGHHHASNLCLYASVLGSLLHRGPIYQCPGTPHISTLDVYASVLVSLYAPQACILVSWDIISLAPWASIPVSWTLHLYHGLRICGLGLSTGILGSVYQCPGTVLHYHPGCQDCIVGSTLAAWASLLEPWVLYISGLESIILPPWAYIIASWAYIIASWALYLCLGLCTCTTHL